MRGHETPNRLLGTLVDGVVTVIVLALLINVLAGFVKPYVPFVLIGAVVYLVARAVARRRGNW